MLTVTGDISSTGLIDLDGASGINFVNAQASGVFTANTGGDIQFTTANTSRAQIIFDAGANISGNSLMTVDVAGLTDSLSLTAGNNITIDSAVSGQDINLTGENVSARFLDAQSFLNVSANQVADLAMVNSGFDTTITSSMVDLEDGEIDRGLRVTAANADLNITGSVNVAGVIDFDATGDITFGALTAGDTFTVDAGGSISFTEANTTRSQIIFNAGADINGGSMFSRDVAGLTDSISLTANAGNVTVGDITSAQDITIRAINIDGGILDAQVVANVVGTGTVDVGALNTGSSTATIRGSAVTLGTADVRNLVAEATGTALTHNRRCCGARFDRPGCNHRHHICKRPGSGRFHGNCGRRYPFHGGQYQPSADHIQCRGEHCWYLDDERRCCRFDR